MYSHHIGNVIRFSCGGLLDDKFAQFKIFKVVVPNIIIQDFLMNKSKCQIFIIKLYVSRDNFDKTGCVAIKNIFQLEMYSKSTLFIFKIYSFTQKIRYSLRKIHIGTMKLDL